jgi:hypothetical protein
MSWEQRQDERLENLLRGVRNVAGERLQERMAEPAGCSSTAVAALQWIDRGRRLRPSDLALEISSPGGSHFVRSLLATGLCSGHGMPTISGNGRSG